MNIRNLLWDLDSTLFDTYPTTTDFVSKSLNEMRRSSALNVTDGLVHQFIDLCVVTLCQRFKLDPELLRACFAEFYRKIDSANQPPFPGVREFGQAELNISSDL